LNNKIANIGLNSYCPEIGQKKPIVQIEGYRLIDHLLLFTPLELKGPGIRFTKKYTDENILGLDNKYKIGWNEYRVSYKAFDLIIKEYAVMIESLQD
jgi:hypothetical protein